MHKRCATSMQKDSVALYSTVYPTVCPAYFQQPQTAWTHTTMPSSASSSASPPSESLWPSSPLISACQHKPRVIVTT